jgi:hypothetical protein
MIIDFISESGLIGLSTHSMSLNLRWLCSVSEWDTLCIQSSFLACIV